MICYSINKYRQRVIYFHEKTGFCKYSKNRFLCCCVDEVAIVYSLFFSYLEIDNASVFQVLSLNNKTFCIAIYSLTSKVVIFSLNYLF